MLKGFSTYESDAAQVPRIRHSRKSSSTGLKRLVVYCVRGTWTIHREVGATTHASASLHRREIMATPCWRISAFMFADLYCASNAPGNFFARPCHGSLIWMISGSKRRFVAALPAHLSCWRTQPNIAAHGSQELVAEGCPRESLMCLNRSKYDVEQCA